MKKLAADEKIGVIIEKLTYLTELVETQISNKNLNPMEKITLDKNHESFSKKVESIVD